MNFGVDAARFAALIRSRSVGHRNIPHPILGLACIVDFHRTRCGPVRHPLSESAPDCFFFAAEVGCAASPAGSIADECRATIKAIGLRVIPRYWGRDFTQFRRMPYLAEIGLLIFALNNPCVKESAGLAWDMRLALHQGTIILRSSTWLQPIAFLSSKTNASSPKT